MAKSTVIRVRRLIDGTGAAPVNDAVVVVRGSRIAAVGPAAQVAWQDEPDAELIVRDDDTLLPGLIDCHVHLNFSGSATPLQTFLEEDDGVLVARSTQNALTALRAGITTIRDCGGRGCTTFAARRAVERGIIAGPRMLLSGRPLTITGGHCHYMNGEADGEDGMRREVRHLIKEGADFIKVMASGGGLTPGTNQRLPSYTVAELRAAVEEAHRQGRRVAAHCHAAQSMANCLEAGVDTLEHASFLRPDAGSAFDPVIAETIVGKGVFVVATLAASYRAYKQTGIPPTLVPETRLAQFREMVEAGVKFAAGTDAGVAITPFDNLALELRLMVEGGLSPMQAIVSATGNAAAALGLGDRVGTVEAGKEADLLLVHGDPLKEIGAIASASLVMKGGATVVR
ncbi:MAG: amidohydrolase family protein [Chloroflexi bacterium]|nr:amidohydrolase family protein [Chloroflexota bacterium]